MSYAVSRRTREIGIRMALGARPAQVISTVLKRTLILCAAGISIGTIATLAAVALVASWNPAARPVHIDPARTLREQ